jgi:triacylglycerol lipase
MDAAENVVLIGGPGTGKSHVATALGIQAIEHHRKSKWGMPVQGCSMSSDLTGSTCGKAIGRRSPVCSWIALSLVSVLIFCGTFKEAGARQLDFKLFYHAAQLANQAYQGGSEIIGKYPGRRAWVATPGSTKVQYVLIHNDQRKIQVIAVRGTANDKNWSLDEDKRAARYGHSGVLLHRGFRTIADTIYRDVKPRLKPGYTTYLTGHSLGGAVAAIMGIYMMDDGVKVGHIVTFGQPKFTNEAGARAYQRLPLTRVMNQNDVVALWPDSFDKQQQQFAHIGPLVNLLPGPHYSFIPAGKAMEASQGALGRYLLQVSVPDHKLDRYLQNLRPKLSGAKEVPLADRERYVVRKKLGTGIESARPIKPSYNFNVHP